MAIRFLRHRAAVLGLLLMGCTADRVVQDDVSIRYSRAELGAAADGRDLRTVIYGDPLGTPGFEDAVTGIMTRTAIGVRTRFTTRPGPSARKDYFVVLAFNPSPDVVPWTLCNGQAPSTDPRRRPIVVRAAFCITGGEATAATGYLADAGSPDDPSFSSLVSQLTLKLFPL